MNISPFAGNLAKGDYVMLDYFDLLFYQFGGVFPRKKIVINLHRRKRK